MPAQEIVERLIADEPQLHFASEDLAREVVQYTGLDFKAGPTNFAVPPFVIRYLAEIVKDDHLTIETGGGHTTVLLAALSRHHTCVTPDTKSIESIKGYMEKVGIPQDKVSFFPEPSEIALPKIELPEKLDFAYIDGNHAYPIPAIDWHFIDLHMKVGGIIGLDNAEIPAVHEVGVFMEQNKSYRWIKTLAFPPKSHHNYCAKFYLKLKDEPQPRSATVQPFNHRRVTRNGFGDSLRTTLRIKGKPWPWS
jgi:predicted O-methyltransferase YrrM